MTTGQGGTDWAEVVIEEQSVALLHTMTLMYKD